MRINNMADCDSSNINIDNAAINNDEHKFYAFTERSPLSLIAIPIITGNIFQLHTFAVVEIKVRSRSLHDKTFN